MILKILLAGDGGQGVQTVADLICRVVFEKGFEVTQIPNYGLEQRGGVSLSYIQISDKKIGYPKFSQADILVIMSDQGRDRTKTVLSPNTMVLDVSNFKQEIDKQGIKLQNLNIFFLKLLANILQEKNIFSKVDLDRVLEEKFCKKANWEEIKNIFK